MAAPRLLPSADEILRLRAAGWTTARIGDTYGTSAAAVSAALGRAGKAQDRRQYPELIPWRVSQKHGHDYNLRMLRWEGQTRSGKRLQEDQRKALASWKARLKRDGVVIDYDSDSGFVKVPRTARDTDLVRQPAASTASEEPDGRLVAELEALARLHTAGDLSDSEFRAAKRKVLGG